MCQAHDHSAEVEGPVRSIEKDCEAHLLALEGAYRARAWGLFRQCGATHLALGQRIAMAREVERRLKEREGK